MMWNIAKMVIGVGALAFAFDFGYQCACLITGLAFEHLFDDAGMELDPEQISASFNAISADELISSFKADYKPFYFFRPIKKRKA